MNHFFRLSILIIFIVFSCKPAFSQEKNLFSLYDAISYALENNNELNALKNALSASERDIGIAKSSIMPKARFSEDFITTNNPAQVFALKLNQTRLTSSDFAGAPNSFNDPGNITNFLTSVALEQPVYIRKANIAINMAKKEFSAQGYTYLRKQEALVNNVVQAYIYVNTAGEYVKVAQQGIFDAKEHLKTAESRYKNEAGLYSDVLRAKTAVTEAEQVYITSLKNLNIAKRALGLLLGLKDLIEVSNTVPLIELKDINYYDEISLCRNDILAMEVNAENAKNGVKLANADWFPTIATGASYNLYDHRSPFAAEGHNYIAGAFLKWDIFDGNKRKYETLKAKDKEAEAQEYLEYMRKTVSFKVFEAYSNVQEAAKKLELALDALKSAEEGRRLVEKRWENSLSPFVDLMDAQTNLDKARANVIKSSNDYKSALINLSFESGIINKDLALSEQQVIDNNTELKD
jgi:outer membrane protein